VFLMSTVPMFTACSELLGSEPPPRKQTPSQQSKTFLFHAAMHFARRHTAYSVCVKLRWSSYAGLYARAGLYLLIGWDCVKSLRSSYTGLYPQTQSYRAVNQARRGTSLIRKRTPLGPYRRPMSRDLGGSWGGERFLMSEVPL
jgi:hypothetical protein